MTSAAASTSTSATSRPNNTTAASAISGSGDGEQEQPFKKLKLLQTMLMATISHTVSGSRQKQIEDEVARYQMHACKATDEDAEDPLQFWKRNEKLYPMLSTLVREYLGIPSSSVPVECIFSTTGLLMNSKRNSLNPLPLNMVMLCQGHLNVLG